MRVKRHLEDCRSSSGGGRARTGGEAFPISATRFVEMNMRVDDAWENYQIVRIDFRLRRAGQVLGERDDLSFPDPDVVVATSHEQIEITHGFELPLGPSVIPSVAKDL